MKLVISGVEYDPTAQPFIGDLRLLKAEFGFGWGAVAKRLSAMNEDADMLGMLDDEEFTDALIAWMWMARLRAGDRAATADAVRMTPIDSIQFKAEPGDELPEDGSVPTSAPTDSVRGDADPAADAKQSTKPSTKTSKKRSTAA